jgi:hypothetical protein
MKWTLLTEVADDFRENLEGQAEAAESRARFHSLSQPRIHIALLSALALLFCLGGLAVNKTLEGDEAKPGSRVVARADEASEVAQPVSGKIDYANKTLALIKIARLYVGR